MIRGLSTDTRADKEDEAVITDEVSHRDVYRKEPP